MSQIFLRVGDELIEPGLFAHKRIYVGPIGPRREDVVDPVKGQPARFVHFHSIPNKEQLIVGERGPEDGYAQYRIQARAQEVVAKGVVNQTFGPNCEHISSYIRTEKPESPQLKVCVGLGLAFLCGLILFSGK